MFSFVASFRRVTDWIHHFKKNTSINNNLSYTHTLILGLLRPHVMLSFVASFRRVQAFACFALILLLVAAPVSVLRIIKSAANQKKVLSRILIAVHGAAGKLIDSWGTCIQIAARNDTVEQNARIY